MQALSEHDPDFRDLHYVHTVVTHKRKPGERVTYAALRTVRMHDGSMKKVWAGTQKIDGYWATLRRAVGRKGYNTGAKGTERRERLEQMVRTHQWTY